MSTTAFDRRPVGSAPAKARLQHVALGYALAAAFFLTTLLIIILKLAILPITVLISLLRIAAKMSRRSPRI